VPHGGAVRPMPGVGAWTGTDGGRRPIHGAASTCRPRSRGALGTDETGTRREQHATHRHATRNSRFCRAWEPRRATSEGARPADDYETRYGTDPVTAGEVIRTRATLNESAGRVGRPPDAQRCRAGAGCPCRARRLASDRDLLATFGGYRDPETLEPRRRPVPGLRAGRRAGAGRTTPGGPGGGPIPLRHPRSRATSSRGSGKAAAGIGGCGDSPARSGRARPLRLRAPAPGSCCARANRSPPVAARDRRLSRAR